MSKLDKQEDGNVRACMHRSVIGWRCKAKYVLVSGEEHEVIVTLWSGWKAAIPQLGSVFAMSGFYLTRE